MAFYFLPTIGEFTKEILNLFQIQGIQQDCVHGRLRGGREGKKNCPEFKSISGSLRGSSAMGKPTAFGCILYLGSRGPCRKAKTDTEKKRLQKKSGFSVHSCFPT